MRKKPPLKRTSSFSERLKPIPTKDAFPKPRQIQIPIPKNNPFSNLNTINSKTTLNVEPSRKLNTFPLEHPEQLIIKLQKENKELHNDIRNLFIIIDQNKIEFKKSISQLSEENASLTKENIDLKNKIILQETSIRNFELDRTRIINEKNILKEKYEKEIIDLNKQITNYKENLNVINFEYQNLLTNYHKLKTKTLLEQSNTNNTINNSTINKSTSNEERNYSTIDTPIHHNQRKSNSTSLSIKKSNSINNSISHNNNSSIPKNPKSKTPLRHKMNKQFCSKTIHTDSKETKSQFRNSFTSLNNITILKPKNNNEITKSNNIYNTENELVNLERKIVNLNISYQTILNLLSSITLNESKEIKHALCCLENSIQVHTDKLIQLKSQNKSIFS